MPQRITGHTQLIGIIATPIRHSKSPMMHNTAFETLGLDYAYLAFDFPPEKLADSVKGLKAMGVKGFNVSMPYKGAVMEFLDEVTPAARLIGGVNTVVNENGRYVGYNTDGVGFMEGLRDEGFDPMGKKFTILGSGAAATAICMQGALDGVGEISIFNRGGASFARAEENARVIRENTGCQARACPLEDRELLRRELESSDVLINATNVGMGKLEGENLIPDGSFLRPELLVADVIYSPPETALLKMAREAGCKTVNGLPMVLWQGAAAFKLWTGMDMPVEEVKRVI